MTASRNHSTTAVRVGFERGEYTVVGGAVIGWRGAVSEVLSTSHTPRDSLISSALWKLAEFAKLRYPIQALLRACTLVAVTTRNATWFKVRGAFSKYAYRYLPPSGDGYGRSRVLAN